MYVDEIEKLVAELLALVDVGLCIIIVLYSAIYLKSHVEEPVWAWIKRFYIGVAVMWTLFYIADLILYAVPLPLSWAMELSETLRKFARPAVTITLLSLAMGSILRLRAVGIREQPIEWLKTKVMKGKKP